MYTADYLIERRKALWAEKEDIEEDRKFREAVAKEILCDEDLRNEVISHPEKLIELEFVIVDKKKQVVPFFLNEVQEDFIERLNTAIREFKEGKRNEIRILILKGRQQGFTSFITAYQLAATILHRNFEGFTLADVDQNAQAIFENKAKYPYSQLPERLKPTEKFNNRKEFRFGKINSSWEVATATKNVGRSRTINFFHGSEAAFWQVLMSLMQAAMTPAFTKDCIIIYETTANGFNDFKNMWDSGAYINCFYEWWRTSEYRHNFENAEKEKEFDDLIENGKDWIADRLRWLQGKGLEKTQMYWYYNTYQGMTDKNMIKQEYPCTPEEAFLMSGRPVFDLEKIIKRIDILREKYKKKPYKEGYFRFDWENPRAEDSIISSSVEFIESREKNWVRIYEEPQEGVPYVIGGDTKGEGSDFYTATVVNNITGNRAATFHLNINRAKPYTHQIYCMGIFYNQALIGVEINFNTAPIEELQRLHYPKQFVRRKFDDYTKKIEPRYGFKTDGISRPLIIDKYASLIYEHIELINDIPTLEEAMTFIYDEKGRPDAMDGKHDDLLFSDMIAEQIREQQRRRNAKDMKKTRYTKDMWEDYKNASAEERRRMIELWGEPI